MIKLTKLWIVTALFYGLTGINPGVAQTMVKLKVDPNHRFITYDDNTPFFYLGDTAWELFHRTTREEAEFYLINRHKKGFTVIQAVVLAELEGLTVPNAMGHMPLKDNNPSTPNAAYFEHVDFVVNKAQELGMFMGILPTWGDKFNRRWGVGPEVFTPEKAYEYGYFLANRYKGKPIIWILGGDRIPEEPEDFEIISRMAQGIKEGGADDQLITYHPQGGYSSSQFFHQQHWLDFNMFQSGHGSQTNQNYRMTRVDYQLTPPKPVLDGEPCYEDHPVNWRAENGWFSEFESRRAGYWSMLSGACGHTYGNHNIWQMWLPGKEPVSQARTPWTEALDYPGAFQAGYLRLVFESRDWQKLVPAQDLLNHGPNTSGKEILVALARDGSFLFAYSPFGQTFELDLSKISGTMIEAKWFNPRIGTWITSGVKEKTSIMVFDPPADELRGNDWLLILDVASSSNLKQ